MRRFYWIFVAAAVLLTVNAFAVEHGKERMRNMPIVGGSFDPASVPVGPSHPGNPAGRLDDPIGTVRNAGTTYYDYQHNGTAGKMLQADDDGFIHMVWMNGTTNQVAGPRQINYQIYDPAADSM
jgi:hypothetical protein